MVTSRDVAKRPGMTTKKKTAKKTAKQDRLTFEQAIERLETIVADMEGAELPLDKVLERYAEGTRLVQFCGEKLEEAEKKIEILGKKNDGSVKLKSFDDETDDGKEDEESLF